jgi:hypothetical protein
VSKGRSSILQKQVYQRKQTYTPVQRMNYEPCSCDPSKKVPGWLLDKIAEEKLTGGYDIRRSNQCPTCFEARSVNGTCAC